MTKENKLYKTGEVAKMFSIKKDTLFYYDRSGLFATKYRKGNTRYRYYDSSQIKILDTILSLREMDIPIEQLRQYLEDINNNSFLDLMELENKKLDAKIQDLTIKRKIIAELSKKMKKAMECEYDKLYIIEEMPRYYLSLPIKKRGKSIEEDWNKAYEEFWNSVDSNEIITNGSILPKENFLAGKYSELSYITGFTIRKSDKSTCKGLYANFYIKCAYSDLVNKYKLFQEALSKEGYMPVSDVHEEYIITSLSEKNEENFVTLLSVMVEKGSTL